jgi:hypothetical protein
MKQGKHTGGIPLPTRLPTKSQAKSVRANELRPAEFELRGARTDETVDWLAVWALSLGFCALMLAGIAFFAGADPVGASFILAGGAGIIGVALRASAKPGDYL